MSLRAGISIEKRELKQYHKLAILNLVASPFTSFEISRLVPVYNSVEKEMAVHSNQSMKKTKLELPFSVQHHVYVFIHLGSVFQRANNTIL